MRFILTIFLSFTLFGLFGQTADSLGHDNNPILTDKESDFLNGRVKEQRGSFDFKNKKVVFITGESGHTIMTKDAFFKRPCTTSMKVLTDKEKIETGGYDVFVFSCVKLFTSRQQRKIIKKLHGDS